MTSPKIALLAALLSLSSGACGGSDAASSSAGDADAAPADSAIASDSFGGDADAAVDAEAGADAVADGVADADAVDDAAADADAGESTTTCDLTGKWSGTVTYPIAGCGGAPATDHSIVLTLTQSGTTITGTDAAGAKIAGAISVPNVDMSTMSGSVTGQYIGTINAACDTITGTWHDSLECDSGPFTLHRP